MFVRGLTLLASIAWIIVCGCSGEPDAPGTADLSSLVGQQVRLEGRFDGPGKQADYIVTANGALVYLMGDVDYGNAPIEFGTDIVVEGDLQQYTPPPQPALDEPHDELPWQTSPAYFFIEDANISLRSKPGEVR